MSKIKLSEIKEIEIIGDRNGVVSINCYDPVSTTCIKHVSNQGSIKLFIHCGIIKSVRS